MTLRHWLFGSLFCSALLAPLPARAQAPAPPAAATSAPLTAANAGPLLGDWTIAVDTPNGPAEFGLSLKTTDGKVQGEVTSAFFAPATVTDITQSGTAVTLRYAIDYNGQPVPVVLVINPDGDKMRASFDFAGAMQVDGIGSRKKT